MFIWSFLSQLILFAIFCFGLFYIAQSWQMENRHKTMIEDKFDYGFAVDWMRKDLKIAMDEAKKNNSPLPITKLIDEYYADIQKMGGQRWDTSSLIRRFRK